MNKNKTSPLKLRTARLAVSVAIQQTLEVEEILRKFSKILDAHLKKNLIALEENKISNDDLVITLTGYELASINEAMRDYMTLRIANIVDPHPSAVSLKDFPDFDLKKIREMPHIKAVLRARDNWIGHINKRFIGPVDKKILHSNELINLLQWLEMLVCTETIKEQSKDYEF